MKQTHTFNSFLCYCLIICLKIQVGKGLSVFKPSKSFEYMKVTVSKVAVTSKLAKLVDLNDPNSLIIGFFYLQASQHDLQPGTEYFFKCRGDFIVYQLKEDSENKIESFIPQSIELDTSIISKQIDGIKCMTIQILDSQNKKTMCSKSFELICQWICSLQNFLGQNLDRNCCDIPRVESNTAIMPDNLKNQVSALRIIPFECNRSWDYSKQGSDWNCICKEGKRQSPININRLKSRLSNIKPIFDYRIISADDGELFNNDQSAFIENKHNVVSINVENGFGNVIHADQTIYEANSILFRSPSEHLIDGQRYDLEIQILHKEKSEAKTQRQLILSFLVKGEAGKYNKFFDSLDFIDLPRAGNIKGLTKSLNISDLFSSTSKSITTFPSFSFFEYSGSLTFPPCSENVIWLVADKPLLASTTIIALFKDAVYQPFMLPEKVVQINEYNDIKNSRELQVDNHRSIKYYSNFTFE